ncbi:hypothetical protein FRX31_011203 [Thalictrum thalictroides]|uniref:Uncharacterized protein n=1 Tax=Thalictrum thalictroides TaxID=46969 RepID=A0A7J6WPA9_THATH|nr:hypothetical protein FRX31_011203 [Thalictrum thalictroides]
MIIGIVFCFDLEGQDGLLSTSVVASYSNFMFLLSSIMDYEFLLQYERKVRRWFFPISSSMWTEGKSNLSIGTCSVCFFLLRMLPNGWLFFPPLTYFVTALVECRPVVVNNARTRTSSGRKIKVESQGYNGQRSLNQCCRRPVSPH